MLIPSAQPDNALAQWLRSVFGWNIGLIITGSIGVLVYIYLVRFLTVALQTWMQALHRIRPHMDDAAHILGRTPSETLRRAYLPLLRRAPLSDRRPARVHRHDEGTAATPVMRPFNFDTLATQAYMLISDDASSEGVHHGRVTESLEYQ